MIDYAGLDYSFSNDDVSTATNIDKVKNCAKDQVLLSTTLNTDLILGILRLSVCKNTRSDSKDFIWMEKRAQS